MFRDTDSFLCCSGYRRSKGKGPPSPRPSRARARASKASARCGACCRLVRYHVRTGYCSRRSLTWSWLWLQVRVRGHVAGKPCRRYPLTANAPLCCTGHRRSQGEGIPSPCSSRARARPSCVPGESSPISLSLASSVPILSLILSSFLLQGL